MTATEKAARARMRRAPAIHTPPEAVVDIKLRLSTLLARAFADLMSDGAGEINPLVAAKRVADGWSPFRAKVLHWLDRIRQQDLVIRHHVDREAFTANLWHQVNANIEQWARATFGKHMTAKQVLEQVERVEPEQPTHDAEYTITPTALVDGVPQEVDPADMGMAGSHNGARTGTLRELAGDIADQTTRENVLGALDLMREDDQRAHNYKPPRKDPR